MAQKCKSSLFLKEVLAPERLDSMMWEVIDKEVKFLQEKEKITSISDVHVTLELVYFNLERYENNTNAESNAMIILKTWIDDQTYGKIIVDENVLVCFEKIVDALETFKGFLKIMNNVSVGNDLFIEVI